MLSLLVIALLSYLIGSIPASVWIGKGLYGIDVREHGSGNAGATNAFRVLGWKAGVLATIVDMGKGFVAAGVIARLRIDPVPVVTPLWEVETFVGVFAAIIAILGHMFPVWARFQGGKGVNTAAGALFALAPISMAITLGIFILVLLTTRYVSLASILASIAFPTTVAIRKYVLGADLDGSLLVISILMALSIIVAHHANIGRLLQGRENRVKSFRPAQGMRGRGEL